MITTSPTTPTTVTTRDPAVAGRWRTALVLLSGYVLLSLATVLAMVVLRHHPSLVNSAAWIRGSIVAVVSLLDLMLAIRSARGNPRTYRALRVVTVIMIVAIAVIASVPGTFPTWLKLEQVVCGLLLIGVTILINGSAVRRSFARRG